MYDFIDNGNAKAKLIWVDDLSGEKSDCQSPAEVGEKEGSMVESHEILGLERKDLSIIVAALVFSRWGNYHL